MKPTAVACFVVFLGVLLLAGSSAELSKGVSPMVCQSRTSRSLWQLPEGVPCAIDQTKMTVPIPTSLNLMKANILAYSTEGTFCSKTKFTRRLFTTFLGYKYNEGIETELPVSSEECQHMRNTKNTPVGALKELQPGIWTTSNVVHWEHTYCCKSTSYSAVNFKVLDIKVYVKHGDKQITSSAPTAVTNCQYFEGHCNLGKDGTLIWSVNTSVSCQYVFWRVYQGKRSGASWIANDHSMALTWPKPVAEHLFTDCGKKLLKSHQGLVIQWFPYLDNAHPRPEFWVEGSATERYFCVGPVCGVISKVYHCRAAPDPKLTYLASDVPEHRSLIKNYLIAHTNLEPNTIFIVVSPCERGKAMGLSYDRGERVMNAQCTYQTTGPKVLYMCVGKRGTLAREGIALPPEMNSRVRRATESKLSTSFVTNGQLAAGLQSLYQVLRNEMKQVYVHALHSICTSLNLTLSILKAHTVATPTLTLRVLLDKPYIYATSAMSAFEVFPCQPIPLSSIEFLPHKGECTYEIPIQFSFLNQSFVGHIDPKTNIINTGPATPHSCSLEIERPIILDGEFYLYHGSTGKLENGTKPTTLGVLAVKFSDSIPTLSRQTIFHQIPVMYTLTQLDEHVSLNQLLTNTQAHKDLIDMLIQQSNADMAPNERANAFASQILERGLISVFSGQSAAVTVFFLWISFCCAYLTLKFGFNCLRKVKEKRENLPKVSTKQRCDSGSVEDHEASVPLQKMPSESVQDGVSKWERKGIEYSNHDGKAARSYYSRSILKNQGPRLQESGSKTTHQGVSSQK